jgi:DNA-binding MarR family transcriptional regulator
MDGHRTENPRRYVVEQQGANLALDLFVVDQHLGSLMDASLAGTGVTGTLFAVYSQLAVGPRTPGQLSEVLGIRPTTLSGYLATMARSGHTARVRNERDGRSSLISLTGAGRAKVRECRPLVRRVIRAIDGAIGSSSEVDQARALLARIDDALQAAAIAIAASRRVPPTGQQPSRRAIRATP